MAFRVEITREAQRDAEVILKWLMSHEPGETGLRWFRRMARAIASLAEFPTRCASARENDAFSF
jgi:plasmid stabilization system protein ParE